jgi:hypothetical protein
MLVWKSKWIVATLIVLIAVLLAACGGGAPATAEGTDENVFLAPLPSDRAEMQIVAPNGALPCGIAEATWGYRVFRVNEFSACQNTLPNLTVYCLDGTANWSPANVSNIDVSTQTSTVAFEVRQDGLCGLFPTGG